MTPYVRQFVSDEDAQLLEKIRNVFCRLPDIDLGVDEEKRKIVLSCHILARAVSKVFSLRFVDGYFKPNFEHSWVLSPNEHIIDVYPVAILGGPILVYIKNNSPARYCYEETGPRRLSRGRFGKSSFRRSVRRVASRLSQLATADAKC
jgi:hypothetical protein